MTRTFKSRAKPDSPRAKILQQAAALCERVQTCFDMYGRLSVAQVQELTGETLSRVRHTIARMRAEGVIHSELVMGDNGIRIAIYSPGPGEKEQKPETKRRIVSKWRPNNKPDPYALPAAFFTQSRGIT